jgi:hypothetical protein
VLGFVRIVPRYEGPEQAAQELEAYDNAPDEDHISQNQNKKNINNQTKKLPIAKNTVNLFEKV